MTTTTTTAKTQRIRSGGFLPADCLSLIFQYLPNDRYTLHSCLLVNRLWCETVVDKLWNQPFRLLFTCPRKSCRCTKKGRHAKSASLIKVYLSCFAQEKRSELLANKITTTTPVFNYVNFLRSIDLDELCGAVSDWIAFTKTTNRRVFFGAKHRAGDEHCALIKFFDREFRLSDHNNGYSVHDCEMNEESEQTSARVFYRLLISRAVNLKSLSIDKTYSTRSATEHRCASLDPLSIDEYGNHNPVPKEFLLLPNYPGASSSLQNLSVFVCTTRASKRDLFTTMAKVSRRLCKISAYLDYHTRGNSVTRFLEENNELIEEARDFATLIKAQTRLVEFKVRGMPFGSQYVMSALRTQCNTLEAIVFTHVGFGEWAPLKDIAECKNLKTLKFQMCYRLSADLVRPLMATNTTFKKLETLDLLNTSAPPEFIETVLTNSNKSLRYVDLGKCDYYSAAGNDSTRRRVIDAVSLNCPNLEHFASFVTAAEMPQVVELLSACPLIKTLILNGEHLPEDDASWLFQRLGARELPNLRQFAIHSGWSFTPESLERFLKGTKARLRVLELCCSSCIANEHLDVILRCLKGVLEELHVRIFGEISEEAQRRARRDVSRFQYETLNPSFTSKDSVFCKMSREWYQKPFGFYCRTTLGGFNV